MYKKLRIILILVYKMKPNHLIANSCITYMQYSQNISISASSLQGIWLTNEICNYSAVGA